MHTFGLLLLVLFRAKQCNTDSWLLPIFALGSCTQAGIMVRNCKQIQHLTSLIYSVQEAAAGSMLSVTQEKSWFSSGCISRADWHAPGEAERGGGAGRAEGIGAGPGRRPAAGQLAGRLHQQDLAGVREHLGR